MISIIVFRAFLLSLLYKLNGGSGSFSSGIISFGIIPKGMTNLTFSIDDAAINDDIQVFTRSGQHLLGTSTLAGMNPEDIVTVANGFLEGATYNNTSLNGGGTDVPFVDPTAGDPLNNSTYNGMNFGYSGDGNAADLHEERITIDNVTESLIIVVTGTGSFTAEQAWGDDGEPDDLADLYDYQYTTIETQEKAQNALEQIDNAIVIKDNARAHLGALQNRFENTISNIEIQTENLKASKSRITDADIAKEMTEFVKSQILTQSATTMLAQANTMPNLVLSLIG